MHAIGHEAMNYFDNGLHYLEDGYSVGMTMGNAASQLHTQLAIATSTPVQPTVRHAAHAGADGQVYAEPEMNDVGGANDSDNTDQRLAVANVAAGVRNIVPCTLPPENSFQKSFQSHRPRLRSLRQLLSSHQQPPQLWLHECRPPSPHLTCRPGGN
jgi:hypothetical protein